MTTTLLERLLIAAGVVMSVIAIGFGGSTTHYAGDPTYSQAGAALGFAIASGLCFLAVAIVHRGGAVDQCSAAVDAPLKDEKPTE